MFRILAAVVASSAALAASALPASASSVQPTAIEGFASSVTAVTYQQPVTFTGELVTGGTTPVPNEPVQIYLHPIDPGTFTQVASGVTGADGKFSITTTLPSGGYAQARFAGDASLGLASSHTPEWGTMLGVAAFLPSRLVLNSVPGSVSAGTPVTFSGTMQVQVNGTWQPFQGATPLTLTMEPYTSSQPTARYAPTSGPDGQFSLTEPLSETSTWSIDTSVNGVYCENCWFTDYASASYGVVYGVSKTRVTGFSLPARDEAQHALAKGLHATGTVERWNGRSWVGLAFGAIQLYYRPKGASTWRKDYGTQTGTSGNFKAIAGIHLGTSDWQVRVVPAVDTLTSTSATVTSTMTDATHFASVSITRTSAGSWIPGQITDWRNGQRSFSSLRGLKVRLYYRADGTKTWHAYKTTKLHSSGGITGLFQFAVASKGYGYQFKVVLPAQGPFLSCTSRIL